MKPLLVIGGLVVVGLAMVMWLVLNGSDNTSADTPATAIPPPFAPTGDPTRPSLPTVTATERGTTPVGAPPKEYDLDGKRIRDHRAGDPPPLDIPPNIHPAEGRRIQPSLTAALSDKVRGVMAECKANVPPEALGTTPRLEGQIVIAIKDKLATIVKATMQLRDVVGAALEPTKQCLEKASIGLQTSAGDEADLESYSINLSYAFR